VKWRQALPADFSIKTRVYKKGLRGKGLQARVYNEGWDWGIGVWVIFGMGVLGG
jgi:hypothetical protein